VPERGEQKPFLPPRWIIRSAWAIHRAIYRWSGGRRGLRRPTANQYGLMRLHSIGRRTNTERIAMLAYFEDGPNLVTMAMNGWGEPEPAWWLNLKARRDVAVDLVDGRRFVRARAAEGDDRERLWARWRAFDANLDAYAARRPGETAVVVLEPA